MSMISGISVQGSIAAVSSNSQPSEVGGDFVAVLAAVRRGEDISDAQMTLWESHKSATGQVGGGPDEVEMAGMVKGFKMEFPTGFPTDLRERLEAMYGDCKTASDRYKFINMYAGTFSPSPGGPQWDSSWKQRLQYTISANEQLAQGLDSISARGTREIDDLLRRLLGSEVTNPGMDARLWATRWV